MDTSISYSASVFIHSLLLIRTDTRTSYLRGDCQSWWDSGRHRSQNCCQTWSLYNKCKRNIAYKFKVWIRYKSEHCRAGVGGGWLEGGAGGGGGCQGVWNEERRRVNISNIYIIGCEL